MSEIIADWALSKTKEKIIVRKVKASHSRLNIKKSNLIKMSVKKVNIHLWQVKLD